MFALALMIWASPWRSCAREIRGSGAWLPCRSAPRSPSAIPSGGRSAAWLPRSGVADDRGSQTADRPPDGIADGDRGAERQGSQAPDPRISRAQDRQGEAQIISASANMSASERDAGSYPLRP